MACFETQLRSTVPDNPTSLDTLSLEFTEFKKSVGSILSLLRLLIDSLTLRVDDLETHSRRNALIFTGIQETEGENCLDVILNIIHTILGLVDIQATSLLSCHRLGSKAENRNRPILVRFADIVNRNTVWREKKKLKSSPTFVGEFLTKSKQDIFTNARKHFGITRSWTQGGQVIIKLPNNERKKVSSSQELVDLIAKFPNSESTKKPLTDSNTAHSSKKTAEVPAPTLVPPQNRNRPAAAAAKAKFTK